MDSTEPGSIPDSANGESRNPRDWSLALAVLACLAYLLAALTLSRGTVALTPDSSHYAVLARSLLAGHGYTMEIVPFHVGLSDEIRRVPEMHALLRPFLLVPLFAVFGEDASLVRVPGFLFVAATGLVAFFLARRLFGDAAGLLATLLVLASRRLAELAWMGIDDAGYAFFFLWSIAWLHRGICDPRERFFAWAGVIAGIGLLEKLVGIFMPGLLILLLLRVRSQSPLRLLRCGAAFALPFLAFFSMYLVRNLAAHGGVNFPYSALEWVWKIEGYGGFFALHEGPIALSELLGGLGIEGVARIVGEQFRLALATPLKLASPSPWLFSLGLAAALLHLRRDREFGLLCLTSAFGVVSLTCLISHVEYRYYAMLIPLFAVALAGGIARIGEVMAPGRRGYLVGGAAMIALAVIVVAQALPAFLVLFETVRGNVTSECAAAHEQAARRATPGDPILALLPWYTNWYTNLPSIVVPSRPDDAIERVVLHYEVRWIVGERAVGRPEGNMNLYAFLADPPSTVWLRRVGGTRRCPLYQVEPSRTRPRGKGAAARAVGPSPM